MHIYAHIQAGLGVRSRLLHIISMQSKCVSRTFGTYGTPRNNIFIVQIDFTWVQTNCCMKEKNQRSIHAYYVTFYLASILPAAGNAGLSRLMYLGWMKRFPDSRTISDSRKFAVKLHHRSPDFLVLPK